MGRIAFPLNFHNRKLGEIMVFYAVEPTELITWKQLFQESDTFKNSLMK